MKGFQVLANTFVLAALLAASGSSALGNQLQIDRISGHYSGNAGEFTILPTDAGLLNPLVSGYDVKATYTYTSGAYAGQAGLQTFCIEDAEYVTVPGSYHYDLSSAAVKGGQAVADTVSVGVGYLYSQFAQGILSGYNYTVGSGRNTSAGVLQQAIWYLEGEISLGSPLSNPFLSQVAGVFGSLSIADDDAVVFNGQLATAGYFGVGAVNMGPANQQYPNQDQLYYNHAGNTDVPDGGTTLMLLGMAMAGLASVRRRLG